MSQWSVILNNLNMKNFIIEKNRGIVSEQFLNKDITDFDSACIYISALPYKRNTDKNNILCVFHDLGGTCSTKHAVLRKLALENGRIEMKLMLGIFKMDAEYTGKITNTLHQFNLKYIPEAHNYLKIEGTYYDYTKSGADHNDFKDKILVEKEIEYYEVVEEKILYHKNFLEKWIKEEYIPYSLDEVWNIREQCIRDLQDKDNPEICNFSPVCYENSIEIRDEFKQ